MLGLSFRIIERCNWRCKYCHYHTINVKEEFIENIIKNEWINKYISSDFSLCLTGGEPGLLSYEYFEEFFNVFNYKFDIFTNGTLLNQKYFNNIKDRFNTIFWHYHPDPAFNIQFPKNFDSNIIFVIVLYPDNIDLILNIIKNNPNNQFELKIITNKTNDIYSFDIEKMKKFNKDITGLGNIIDKTKNEIENLVILLESDKVETLKRMCYKNIKFPTIDLINNKIYSCCISDNTEEFNLNESDFINMKYRLNNFEKYKCEFCNKATRILDKDNLYNFLKKEK